jgi:hypothetical protein
MSDVKQPPSKAMTMWIQSLMPVQRAVRTVLPPVKTSNIPSTVGFGGNGSSVAQVRQVAPP